VVAIRLGEVPRIVVTHPALVGEGPLPSTTEQLQRLPWLALRTYYTDEVGYYDGGGIEKQSAVKIGEGNNYNLEKVMQNIMLTTFSVLQNY